MKRREFITLLGGAAAVASLLSPNEACAQPAGVPVIGVLYGVSAAEWTHRSAAILQGLRETGFVEGRNVAIEYRWAEGQLERMPWMAADLIGRRVAVILTGGSTTAVRALASATQAIPIVFTSGADPVEAGIVASFNRPGGNVTGVTVVSGELGPKRLELMHEVVPGIKKIAILVNQTNQVVSEVDIRATQASALRLGLEVLVINGGSESETETAFALAVQQHVGAVLVGSDAVLNSRREQIARLGLHHKLPTMSSARENAEAGQLITYGANISEMYRQAGRYVGRILKGEKPGDLPVLQPTKFELSINLNTAKALGLTIPESFLLRADAVIE
jgi:putative ABC transport system substrate-binding protein